MYKRILSMYKNPLDDVDPYLEELVGGKYPIFFDSIKNLTKILFLTGNNKYKDEDIKQYLNVVYDNIIYSLYNMSALIEGYVAFANTNNITYDVTLTEDNSLIIILFEHSLSYDSSIIIEINIKQNYISFVKDIYSNVNYLTKFEIIKPYVNINDTIIPMDIYTEMLSKHYVGVKYDSFGFDLDYCIDKHKDITIGIIFLIRYYLEHIEINDERMAIIDNLLLLKIFK